MSFLEGGDLEEEAAVVNILARSIVDGLWLDGRADAGGGGIGD